MRSLRLAPVVAVISLLLACGSSSTSTSGPEGDASTAQDSGSSSGSGSGSGGGSGSSSGSSSGDAGGSSSGGDAGFACSSPADCSGNVCCATIPLTGGTVPNCTTGTITVACTPATQCPTMLGTTCSGQQTVRLCKQTADCTESGANKCCTFMQNGGSIQFCANAIVAGIAGATCL